MPQTFEQAQNRALSYANRERQHQRNAPYYFVFALVSTLITYILAPYLALACLVLNALSYLAFRYADSIWTHSKHAWLNWKVQRQSPSKNISMQALAVADNPEDLIKMGNGEISQNLQKKAGKIKAYEQMTNLEETDPLPYYDFKHKRALYQYSMLQSCKEAALKGRGDIVDDHLQEKNARRDLKIQILEMLKDEFILTKKLSIILKHTPGTSAGSCTLGGNNDNKTAFLTKMKQINNAARYPLLDLPLEPEKETPALLNTLLPLVLDLDHVAAHLRPMNNPPMIRSGKIVVQEQKYFAINAQVIVDRLERLKEKVVNEREFELRV
jgi:hypothetical protein